MKPELHLFIIWEHARIKERALLADLAKKFQILKTYEIHWSKKYFAENLTRFYGTNLPPGSGKEEHVGNGPFLLVIVKDLRPSYDTHLTSKGEAVINSNMFLTKTEHRELTGGGHKIHATNTPAETNHDLVLLLGINEDDFLAKYDKPGHKKVGSQIEVLKRDLVGAGGWKSIKEFFYALNASVEYLVMRNFEPLPDKYYAGEHGDIDILAKDYEALGYIAGTQPVFQESHRVHNVASVAGKDVYFDFRFLGDDYYARDWETSLLEHRQLTRGLYVPSRQDYYFSLLYHALIHKPDVKDDYVDKLNELNETAEKIDRNFFTLGKACKQLGVYLADNGYRLVVPKDKSVFFNRANARRVRRAMRARRPGWYLKGRLRNVLARD